MAEEASATLRFRLFLSAYIVMALLLAMASVYFALRNWPLHSIYEISFLSGPVAQSMVERHDMAVRMYIGGTANNYLVLHAGRMPLASLFIAACAVTLGPARVSATFVLKAVLLLTPLFYCAGVILWRARNSFRKSAVIFVLLSLPFVVPTFLADVINLNAEEGFLYSLLALAFFLAASCKSRSASRQVGAAVGYALLLDLIYLCKSSMIGAVVVLAAAYFVRLRSVPARIVLLLWVLLAPVSWALWQHHASGRYSLGTSSDGANLNKGNYPEFLRDYPGTPLHSLDQKSDVVFGDKQFQDEWEWNDWCSRQAINFMRSHPGDTARGWLRKIYVLFFALRAYGNGYSAVPIPMILLGMAAFRTLFWGAAILSLSVRLRSRRLPEQVWVSSLFLGLVAACAAPYLLGFGYTRHASVLIYPAAMTICLLLGSFQVPKQEVFSAQTGRES